MLKTIRSFTRRERRMTRMQQEALNLFSQFGLEIGVAKINLPKIFGRIAPVILEIGFGMGQSLIEMALKNPDQDYIGIEVYLHGISALLGQIAKHNLTNIRVYHADAVEVLRACIPDHSLDKVLIFFPDPWPKRRHHKRRIVQTAFAMLVQSKLKLNGCLHLATDWEDYAKHILSTISAMPGFCNLAGSDNFIARPDYRPITKFEERGMVLGHSVWDLMFETKRL
jgi:tRNA (guanine-N7-)-methyltransferase